MVKNDIFAGLTLAFLSSLAPVAAAAAAAPASGEDRISYQMKAGENLYILGQRYLNRPQDYRTVQRLNQIADPIKIPTGRTLAIPVALLKTQPLMARVMATRGDARIISGGASTSARAGAPVNPGSILETGADGFVSVGLSNGSQLSIPTRSRVRLNAMHRIILTNAVRFDIAVDKGKLETQATPLAPGGGDFRLHTPRALSAIRGTILRVGYDTDTDLSATEVLDGTVAVQGASAQAATMVAKGFGASISPTGAVTPEALLPAPELENPGQVLVNPDVMFRIRPLDGARAYHVQVAADAGFTDMVAEATATGPAVPIATLADGRWFARVSAISASGIEGEAQTYSVRRALTGIDAAASQDAGRLLFKWAGSGAGKRLYRFQLAQGDPKSAPIIDEPGLTGNEMSFSGLPDGIYYWRIQVRQFADGDMTENWTPFQKLTVAGMKP